MLRQWMEVALKGLPESLQEAKYKGLYHDDNTCTCTCTCMFKRNCFKPALLTNSLGFGVF